LLDKHSWIKLKRKEKAAEKQVEINFILIIEKTSTYEINSQKLERKGEKQRKGVCHRRTMKGKTRTAQ